MNKLLSIIFVALFSVQAWAGELTGGIGSSGGGGGSQQTVLCQGVDDTATIQAAINSGVSAVILSGTCVTSNTLTPQSNQSLQGTGVNTSIALVSGSISTIISLQNLTGTTVANLTLNGASALAGGTFIKLYTSVNCTLNNVNLVSPPANTNGSIDIAQTSTGNSIIGGSITNSAGTAISLNSANVQGNTIDGVRFSGSATFNVHLYGTTIIGPSRNIIRNTYSKQSGVESIALGYSAFENRIIGNHAEGAGDNGMSIVGYRNIVMGNELIGNSKAGVWVWGSQNTITGNVGINNDQVNASNWPCIGIDANFGGTGQNNVVVGNSCDDDQVTPTQNGITETGTGYTAWAQGQSITNGNYRTNGLNIYQASNTGTSGASAPTCTSGTCSDGTITWTYLNSFIGAASPFTNTISGNSVQRFAGTNAYIYNGYTYLNFGQGSINVVLGAGTPASALTAPVGTLFLRSDGGTSTTLYVKETGTSNTGWVAK